MYSINRPFAGPIASLGTINYGKLPSLFPQIWTPLYTTFLMVAGCVISRSRTSKIITYVAGTSISTQGSPVINWARARSIAQMRYVGLVNINVVRWFQAHFEKTGHLERGLIYVLLQFLVLLTFRNHIGALIYLQNIRLPIL
jgi:hypothetical protein